MTEEEWLNATDVGKLLEYLTGRTSDRKFRLFGCACCRGIWHLLSERCRRAVVVAEQYADGTATDEEVEEARRDANECCNETALTPGIPAKFSWAYSTARLVLFDAPFWKPNQAEQHAAGAARSAAEAAWRDNGEDGPAPVTRRQLAFFRDVFENPYRPGWVDDEWRTSTVLALAHQMYESRDFTPMPILADALQDAGCDEEAILAHCRGEGPHVRGCWVVDLVIGKESP